jgi:type VI secretion system protein ImpA
MSFDLESLLTEVSPSAPTGENLEYDPAFAALERSLAGKPERQAGNEIVAAEPPEWDRVEARALELLQRTKDLRVAVPLLRARVNREGLTGLAEGLALVRGLIDKYWPSLHPQLDPDDPTDATMRLSAVSALCLPDVIAELRAAGLAQTRGFGPISLRALDEGDPAGAELALREVGIETMQRLSAALLAATADIAAIEAAFASVSTPAELGPLSAVVTRALGVLAPFIQEAAELAAEQAGQGSADGQSAGRRGVGELASREDVVRAIDQICKYYARYEPSSPIPLLLQRCKRLATMSFIDIVKDMAPDAVSRVEIIAGKTEE